MIAERLKILGNYKFEENVKVIWNYSPVFLPKWTFFLIEVKIIKNQILNFSGSAPFNPKSKVFLKHFVHGYKILDGCSTTVYMIYDSPDFEYL